MKRRIVTTWSVIAAVTAIAALGLSARTSAERKARPEPAPASRPQSGPYRLAVPPYAFKFPRDHAAHPEFQTEWWYYTGHLYSGDRRFGYQLTFFQVGIDPKRKQSRSAWALHTLYFGHFTVTDENGQTFRFTEEVSRPALGMAGAETDRYRVWLHDWTASLLPDNRTHHLRAASKDYGIDLRLTSARPPVIHGFGGVSQKAKGVGRASHYYSLTRLETSGTLILAGKQYPVTGLSWMDHEFGSNQLTPEQLGWDWFSLQLDNGRELMLYVLRLKDGGVEPMSSGTVVNGDGTWKHLPVSAYRIDVTRRWKSPKSGSDYPAGWVVRVPGERMDLRITPAVQDQELVTEGIGVNYWEGSVRVEGTDQGRTVRGAGYVELTGYSGAVPGI